MYACTRTVPGNDGLRLVRQDMGERVYFFFFLTRVTRAATVVVFAQENTWDFVPSMSVVHRSSTLILLFLFLINLIVHILIVTLATNDTVALVFFVICILHCS